MAAVKRQPRIQRPKGLRRNTPWPLGLENRIALEQRDLLLELVNEALPLLAKVWRSNETVANEIAALRKATDALRGVLDRLEPARAER